MEAKGLRLSGRPIMTTSSSRSTSLIPRHRLELTVRTCHDQKRLQGFVDEAPEVLALWDKTHDWSQREKVFGAKTGYSRTV